MSESINNNIAINQSTSDYNIDDKQDINTNTKPTKTTKNSGINSISYGNETVKQITQDTQDNLIATLLTQDPNVTEKMVTELCSNLSIDELKTITKESLDIFKGLTTFAGQNIKTNDNVSAPSVELNSLVGNFSSFDIRELMKLLIQAFAQFFSTQRELDLATTSQIQQAMETKIAAMEKEKDETYKAAMAQAIGSIVSGALSVWAGLVSVGAGTMNLLGGLSGSGALAGVTEKGATLTNQTAKGTTKMIETFANITNASAQLINGLGGIANGVSGMVSAGHTKDAKDAQIEQTTQDATLEILKKMEQEGSEQTKQLMEFITRILSMIQELQQSAAQTEKTIVQA